MIGWGMSILWGVENCPFPLTKPVAVNTGLALPRSLWYSGESTDEEHATGVGTGESEIQRLEWRLYRQKQIADSRYIFHTQNDRLFVARKTSKSDEGWSDCEKAEQWWGYVDTRLKILWESTTPRESEIFGYNSPWPLFSHPSIDRNETRTWSSLSP